MITSQSIPSARAIFWAAVLLIAVQVAYFAYYAVGVTQTLWNGGAGFYFSENDVLHVGMLLWLWFVAASLGPRLADRGDADAGDPTVAVGVGGGAP